MLVLPNVSVLADDEEKASFASFRAGGGRLVITGADATAITVKTKGVTQFAECPGKDYFDQLQKDF